MVNQVEPGVPIYPNEAETKLMETVPSSWNPFFFAPGREFSTTLGKSAFASFRKYPRYGIYFYGKFTKYCTVIS